MKTGFGVITAAVLLVSGSALSAGPHDLLIIGGGEAPKAAMDRFHERAGGVDAQVAFVHWATEREDARKNPRLLRPKNQEMEGTDIGPDCGTPSNWESVLRSASGVFFTGGDQNRLMQRAVECDAVDLVHELYASGIVVGGTSAGAAVMSSVMITGQVSQSPSGFLVGVARGIGFLLESIIDQHFLTRPNRFRRLRQVVLDHPGKLGVGIDEDTSIWVEEGKTAEVIGPSSVLLLRNNGAGDVTVGQFTEGERFDL